MNNVNVRTKSKRVHGGFTRKSIFATGLAAILFVSQQGMASPLGLAQSPLFVSEGAPANVFFLNDDSLSMDWQFATVESDGVMWLTVGGTTTQYSHVFPDADNASLVTNQYGRILPDEDEVIAASDMPANAHNVWLGRISSYNKIYYNPEVTYQPWQGVDNAGVLYANANPAAVRLDAYLAASPTVNLNNVVSYTAHDIPRTVASGGGTSDKSMSLYRAMYYTYTDSNSNGKPDPGEPHTRIEIRSSGCSSGPPTTSCPSSFAHTSVRTDCPEVSGVRTCNVAQELQNFANWYQYYRRRELSAKAAIANVVAPVGSEVRMGYGTLHKATSATSKIASMNLSVASGNKKSLLDNLFTTQGKYVTENFGTPLRTKLFETGQYYECLSSGTIVGNASGANCPWLPAPQGTCQQSFTIMLTDGFYNDTTFDSLPGSGSNKGQVDRDGNSPNAAGNTSFDGGAYGDDVAKTLGDIAMHFYERDLNTSLANSVPVIAGIDDASHQHMVTYTVGFGVSGTLASGPTNPALAFTWPDPLPSSNVANPEKIDDLRHAAYNGRGKFLDAKDPVGLASSLKTAIESITETTGSASAVAVNSRTLTTGTTLYQARFKSLDWSGDLRAITLNDSTGDTGGEVWSAGEKLKTQATRSIITYRKRENTVNCPGMGSGTDGGVPFTYANLSDLQKCLLNDNPVTPAFDNDTFGDERVDYMRGSTTNEGISPANFRIRAGGFKLGDIVNSTPIYIGAPDSMSETNAPGHAAFRSTYSTRPAMLYVGANDGMLHGFDANTGSEKIAYVPAQVYPNLSKLSDPNYRTSHLYFVDGSPAVADAFGNFTNGCSSSACWRTVLVGGLAGGGKGIFALDVTDPNGANISNIGFNESNAGNIALWEFYDSSTFTPNADMGNVYGEITVAKMHNGQWAAIFGNGYNSANENAVLYIVNIADGTLIRKIVLNPYGTATGNSNGLSAPAVFDADGDLMADYIYAGDLRGNLWKVDVTSSDPTIWDSPHKSGALELPLFKAVDPSALEQPITARPAVRVHPDGQTGYMVYIGTGRYIADGDKTPASSPRQTIYGIWDKNISSASTPVARANLLAQTITQTTPSGDRNGDGQTNAFDGFRVVSANPISWTTHKGWRLDLRTDQTDSLGEMSVTNPVLATNTPERLIFTTLVPTVTACEFGGSSWLMEVSPISGGNLGVGIFDVDGDGDIDASDMVGGGFVSGIGPGIGILPEVVIVNKPGAQPLDLKLVSGSTGDVKSIKNYLTPPPPGSGTGPGLGRRSWRQLK